MDISNVTEKVYSDILSELKDDYVGVWEICKRFELYGLAESAVVKRESLNLITDLLTKGHAKFGTLKTDGFHEDRRDANAITSEISKKMNDTNNLPDIGEIGWLA